MKLKEKMENYRISIRKNDYKKILKEKRVKIIIKFEKDIENKNIFANWKTEIKKIEKDIQKYIFFDKKNKLQEILKHLNFLVSKRLKRNNYSEFFFFKTKIIDFLQIKLEKKDLNFKKEIIKEILNFFLMISNLKKNNIDHLLEKNLISNLLPLLKNFNFDYIDNIISILSNIILETNLIFQYYKKYNLINLLFLNYEKFIFDKVIKKSFLWNFICILKYNENLEKTNFENLISLLKNYLSEINDKEDLLEIFIWFEFYLDDKFEKDKILILINLDLNSKIKEILKSSDDYKIIQKATKIFKNFSFFDKKIIDSIIYKNISEDFSFLLTINKIEIKKNILIISKNLICIYDYYNYFFKKKFIESILFILFQTDNKDLILQASFCLYNIFKGLKIHEKCLKSFLEDFSIIEEIFYLKKNSFNEIIFDILYLLIEEIKNSYNSNFEKYIDFLKNHVEILEELEYEDLIIGKIIKLIQVL